MTGTTISSIVSNCAIIAGTIVMPKQCANSPAVVCANVVSLTLRESNNMTFMQSTSYASYGPADSLNADEDTIREFVGRSALPAIDTLALLFLRESTWTVNRTGSDFTTNTIHEVFQLKNE